MSPAGQSSSEGRQSAENPARHEHQNEHEQDAHVQVEVARLVELRLRHDVDEGAEDRTEKYAEPADDGRDEGIARLQEAEHLWRDVGGIEREEDS